MKYQSFTIENYKAIKSATIDLTVDGLVLLLGINESGKTSVLRAIESFDYTNDNEDESERTRFYKSIRNKKELNSEAKISAELLVEMGLVLETRSMFTRQAASQFTKPTMLT